MNELFLKIINVSISASWLVVMVLLLRVLLRRAPKWVNVLLWGIVAARLLLPFSIESALSLIPSAETIPSGIEMGVKPEINSGIALIDGIVNPILGHSSGAEAGIGDNPMQIAVSIGGKIWGLGASVLLAYTIVSYFCLYRKIRTAILYRDNIYQSENVNSPFVFGFVKPRIYVPFGMDNVEEEYVIAHEYAHIRRKDHWWKLLGFLLTSIHWFNPLIWVAYVLLCRDIELACDEKVISALGNQERADYTQALLSASVNHRVITACPLAFGEVGVKARVKSVMNYKKPGVWMIVLAIVVCVALAIGFLTNPISYKGGLVKWFDENDAAIELGQGSEIQLPEIPRVVFQCTSEKIIATDVFGGGIERVIVDIGTPTVFQNAYFCDLNGDGYPELCVSLWVGSGFIDSRVIVYDHANNQRYELEDRTYYDYFMRVKRGRLYVEKRVYATGKLVDRGWLELTDGEIEIN